MSKALFIVFVLAFSLSVSATGEKVANVAHEFRNRIHSRLFSSIDGVPGGITQLPSGMEGRIKITMITSYVNPLQGFKLHSSRVSGYFNASMSGGTKSIRIRVIPAYGDRLTTGTAATLCPSHSNVWAEYWGASADSYQFAHSLITSGYVTFVVPPFPFKLCVSTTTFLHNTTAKRVVITNSSYTRYQASSSLSWMPFHNDVIFRVNRTARYFWNSASTMYTGDFAAIQFHQNGYFHPWYVPSTAGTSLYDGDLVKLVPAGFPCSYQKKDATTYCGRKAFNYDGTVNSNYYACVTEGSVTKGVGIVGSSRYNPFSETQISSPKTLTDVEIRSGEHLVAYFELPDAGVYDICLSPLGFRKGLATTGSSQGSVWFKTFKLATGCSVATTTTAATSVRYSSSCYTSTRLSITANADTTKWSSEHIYPGGWGTIQVNDGTATGATGTLSNAAATAWELSTTRDYFTTAGGDQFRIVRSTRFTADAMSSFGNMYLSSTGSRLTTAIQEMRAKPTSGADVQSFATLERIDYSLPTGTDASLGTLSMRFHGTPATGTATTLPSGGGGGCWNNYDDNYGNRGKALNGISSMGSSTTRCCDGTSSPFACVSTSGCSFSDTYDRGVTASADLGGDPHSSASPWTISSTSKVQDTWAYIRFPVAYRWFVCYRKAGTENWRKLNARSGLNYLEPSMVRRLNYTYHVNDTRTRTWGPIVVRDLGKSLTTQNHNYQSTATTFVGSSLKIVKHTASCYTDSGETEAYNTKPGLVECELSCINNPASCGMTTCLGSAHDSSDLRFEVAFYVRMPVQLSTDGYRVCFRNLAQAWIEIADRRYLKGHKMSGPWLFNTLPTPSVSFALMDVRQGTWGKFLLRRMALPFTEAFNIERSIPTKPADTFRIVQNVTASKVIVHCDATIGATDANGAEFVFQNYDASRTVIDFGVYCMATTSTRCATTKTAPTNTGDADGTVATFPYTDIDSTADGNHVDSTLNEGTVAFLTLPANPTTPTSAGYRLCYKPHAGNWIEVTSLWNSAVNNPMTVVSRPAHVYTLGDATGAITTPVAGQYGYIQISGDRINLDYDVVKLVLDSTGGCDRPAAGTQSTGNAYISLVYHASAVDLNRGGRRLVPSATVTSTTAIGSRGTVTSARAYMTFPSLAGLAAGNNAYKVCYMQRSSYTETTRNWQHLGNINVESIGIAYTAETQPYNGGVLRMRIVTSGTYKLNTLLSGDQAKIIDITSPCIGPELVSAARPSGLTSNHVGLEMDKVTLGATSDNVTLLENGIVDLGPADNAATTFATFSSTLPISNSVRSNLITYKVCYRLTGKAWAEIDQAPIASQKYALGTDKLKTSDASINGYVIGSTLLGVTPLSNQAEYATGLSYTAGVLGGVATATIGSSANTSAFYVSYDGTVPSVFTSDEFKLVQYSREIVRGTYQPVPNVDCNADGVISGNARSVGGQVAIVINMPTQGGRYLLCYRKSGLSVWLQLPAISGTLSNPFYVYPTTLGFAYANNNITVNDLFSISKQVDLKVYVAAGSMFSTDKIYIVNSTDVCGFSHSFAYDTKNPTATASIAASYQQNPVTMTFGTNLTRSINYTVPTIAGWYKVCYYRSSTDPGIYDAVVPSGTTTATATVKSPFPIGWYHIANVGTANGASTPYFVTSSASKIRINKCPNFNASFPVRPGTPFDISVSVLDSTNQVLPFSVGTWAYLITAAPDTTGTFSMQNTRGQCEVAKAPTYGWDENNLRQWTEQGMVTFTLAINSACPTSGPCDITFAASNSIAAPTAPTKCSVYVKSTPINTIGIWSAPDSCSLGAKCEVRLASFFTDGGLAQTATNAITITPSSTDANALTGISITANAQTLSANTATSVGNFKSGFSSVDIRFDITNGVSVTANTPVTFTFTSAGKTTTKTITVLRPKLTKVYITDLYPSVGATYAGDRFIRTFMVPSWEPSGESFFPGEVSVTGGKQSLSAASGYHLVAMQTYIAILRGVDDYGNYITNSQLYSPVSTVTLTSTGSAFSSSGANMILGGGCDGLSSNAVEACTSAVSSTSLSADKTRFAFSIKNNQGCTKAAPCTLTFKFGGSDLNGVTSITTPVRSLATQLSVTCWKSTATTEAALGTGTSGACPESTVNVGLAIKAQAVDADGYVDEYFEGNLMPILKGGNGLVTASGMSLTTVAQLSSTGSLAISPTQFSSGVAWIWGLTMSKPCLSGCNVQLVSDWGANIADIGAIKLTTSTTKLKCSLNTALYKCTVDNSDCKAVSGFMTYDTSSADANTASLIYRNTRLCATVQAVDKDDKLSLYDTNWITYWAEAVSGSQVGVSLVDSTSTSRVKAMVRGTLSVCFTVTPSSTTAAFAQFRVRFAAQQFGGSYWANGAAGECSLGTFTVWNKKHIANIGINSVDTDLTPTVAISSPSSAVSAYGIEKATGSSTSNVVIKALDHYGSLIASADLYAYSKVNGVVITGCDGDFTTLKLKSCNVLNTVSVTASAKEETGAVVVTPLETTDMSVSSTNDPTFTLGMTSFCYGCSVTFTLKSADGNYVTAFGSSTSYNPTARLTLYVQRLFTTGSVRTLAFRYGTSPYSTPTWTEAGTPSNANFNLFASSCFTTASPACNTKNEFLIPAVCDEYRRSGESTKISAGTRSTDVAIQFYVYAAKQVLSSPYQPNYSAYNGQVDILNSYDITISIGSQTLRCAAGTVCVDDMTSAPKQTVLAFGTDLQSAAVSYGGTLRSTNFIVEGMNPSNYYTQDASNTLVSGNTPSMYGQISAAAYEANKTTALSGVTFSTSNSLIFRGPHPVTKFTVLDTAKESRCTNAPTYSCVHTSNAACLYDGYDKKTSLDNITYSYAFDAANEASTIVPINTEIPITVEVQTQAGSRAATAKGNVLVELYSWFGCNNGGIMTIRGATANTIALDSGRVTAFVSFTAPCQRCVLRFTLTPDPSQSALFKSLNDNTAQLVQFSKPVDVRDNSAGAGKFLIVTSLPADQKAALTVADAVTIAMSVTRPIGGSAGALSVPDVAASGSVYAYNKVQTTGLNWYWFGNGGVLRRDPTSTTLTYDHHQVRSTFTSSASTSLTFAFTRTCPGGCSVVVAYTVNGNSNSFTVKNAAGTTFTVTTASTKQLLIGWRPRLVKVGTDIALSAWHVGEGAGITFAGVGTNQLSTASVSKSSSDIKNGDGGDMTVTSFAFNRTEAHRISFTRPSNALRIAVGSDATNLAIYTVATTLRWDAATGTASKFTYPNAEATYTVYAVDSLGFVDITVGGVKNRCGLYHPLKCSPESDATIAATLSANGMTEGGFSPSSETFAVARDITGVVTGKMADGTATVKVAWPAPVRDGIPFFKLSSRSLNSGIPSTSKPRDSDYFDITPGTTNMKIAMQTSLGTAVSVPMFTTLTIEVGAVIEVGTTTKISYVTVDAHNYPVKLDFSPDCPARASSTGNLTLRLDGGYVSQSVVFTSPTSGTANCIVTAKIDHTACTNCVATKSFTVETVSATKWNWLSPSVVDNSPSTTSGPMFAVYGGKYKYRLGLLGVNNNANVRVTNCDNPATKEKVETCVVTVTSTPASCITLEGVPSVSVNGTVDFTVTYTSTVLTTNECTIAVGVVTDGTSPVTLTAEPSTGASMTVSLCQPARLNLVTNTSRSYGSLLKTGVPYTITYALVDSTGRHCRGASGDFATEAYVRLMSSAKAVYANGLDTAAYNTNSTTGGIASSWKPTTPQSGRAVAGYISYTLWFAKPMMNFFVQALTNDTNKFASQLSSHFDTIVAATRLRFEADLPQYAVMGRPLPTMRVSAVDGISDDIVGFEANVARLSTQLGNDLPVQLRVSPLPQEASFFVGNATQFALQAGRGSTNVTFSVSRDGAYTFFFAPTNENSVVQASKQKTVYFQTVVGLRLNQTFRGSSFGPCTQNCPLPLGTGLMPAEFNRTVNNTNVQVIIADPLNQPVWAEDEISWLRMKLNADTNSSLRFILADTLTNDAVSLGNLELWAPVVDGVAHFNFLLGGDTVQTTGNVTASQQYQLKFECPEFIPANLTMDGVAKRNPCNKEIKTQQILSQPFKILDPSNKTAYADPKVASSRPVLQIPMAIADLTQVNIATLKNLVADAMKEKFPFLADTNAFQVSVCKVSTTFSGDLGSSVCGPNLLCTAANPNTCPIGVQECRCDGASTKSHKLLSRFLLQQTATGGSPSQFKVQTEITVDLQNSKLYSASSAEDLISTYSQITSQLASTVKKAAETNTAAWGAFSVQTDQISSQSSSNVKPAPTAAPATPVPPPTVPQVPPTPPSGSPSPSATPSVPSGGGSSSGALSTTVSFTALLGAALLALMMAL